MPRHSKPKHHPNGNQQDAPFHDARHRLPVEVGREPSVRRKEAEISAEGRPFERRRD